MKHSFKTVLKIKIRDLFDFSFWGYVKTDRGPNGVVPRGAIIENLINDQLWFYEPKFL